MKKILLLLLCLLSISSVGSAQTVAEVLGEDFMKTAKSDPFLGIREAVLNGKNIYIGSDTVKKDGIVVDANTGMPINGIVNWYAREEGYLLLTEEYKNGKKMELVKDFGTMVTCKLYLYI